MLKGTPPPPEVQEAVSDEDAARLSDRMHTLALAHVRYEYETIFNMAGIPLEVFNRDTLRYQRKDDVIRDYTGRAGAVGSFAVSMRLITPEEAADAIREFHARHPEIWGEDDEEPPAGP
jgi:hypothetical protein